MKKAIRIHISGYIFNIEEDAFDILEKWLKEIESKYKNEKDGNEIYGDIEMRVAELFNDKTGNEGVITAKEVSFVIETMGRPEDFDPEEENEEKPESGHTENKEQEPKRTRKARRLYRDKDYNVFAGVCSGLGKYFGIDPVIIRLIFVAAFLLFGFGPLIYIILWIVIPKAETVSQKLEMEGEPVTIENIEKAVRDEFEYVKNKYFKSKKQK